MECTSLHWTQERGWAPDLATSSAASLLVYFGTREAIASGERHGELQAAHPSSLVVGCSTGGQIRGASFDEAGAAALAIRFERTEVRLAHEPIEGPQHSAACGAALGRALAAPGLVLVFVLSDGLHVNGSGLVEGIVSAVGSDVVVTGGLAGDGADFRSTLVGAGTHRPSERRVAAVGFYGSALRVGHGCAGGWDAFGPRRRVTRASGNVLHELDGQPALDLYRRYLGDEADGLPGTALLFPLRIWDPLRPTNDVVRTVLAVDHEARSMTFAGDVPEGWGAQLMRGAFERLVAGAGDAAGQAVAAEAGHGDRAAILVSCIGRRLLLGQTVEDEIEAALHRLGPGTTQIGFYSYGEISPHGVSGMCELHNQTMTVTTLSEAAP